MERFLRTICDTCKYLSTKSEVRIEKVFAWRFAAHNVRVQLCSILYVKKCHVFHSNYPDDVASRYETLVVKYVL